MRQARRALQEAAGSALSAGDCAPAGADLTLLARLDRYERRALTRRRPAVAAFDALSTPAVGPEGDVAERSQRVKPK